MNVGSNIKMGYAGNVDHDMDVNNAVVEEDISHCSEGCLDPWLADGFCDTTCNTAECGYDCGDCGFEHFERLYQESALNLSTTGSSKETIFYYKLEKGVMVNMYKRSYYLNIAKC